MPTKSKIQKMLKKEIYQKLKDYNIIVPWRTKKDAMRVMLKEHEMKERSLIHVPAQDLIDFYICSIECGVRGMRKEKDYKFPKQPKNMTGLESCNYWKDLSDHKEIYYVKDWEDAQVSWGDGKITMAEYSDYEMSTFSKEFRAEYKRMKDISDAQVAEDLLNFTYVKHGDYETSTLSKKLIADCERIKHKNDAEVDRVLTAFKRQYSAIAWEVKFGLARFLHHRVQMDDRLRLLHYRVRVDTYEPDPSWRSADAFYEPYTHIYRRGVLARFTIARNQLEIHVVEAAEDHDEIRFKFFPRCTVERLEDSHPDALEAMYDLASEYLFCREDYLDAFMDLQSRLDAPQAFIKTYRTDDKKKPLYTEVGPNKIRRNVSVTYSRPYRLTLKNFVNGYDQAITTGKREDYFKIRNLEESVLMGHTLSLS